MAKKQKSFAEKASSKKGKDLVHVKFVKSVPSDKEGFWRFNESMIGLEKGQKLDAALKQMEDEANLVDIEMPSDDSKSVDTPSEQDNTISDSTSQEDPKEDETPKEDEAPAEEETPSEEEAPSEDKNSDTEDK